MGSHHNLFGDPNEAYVMIDGPDQFRVTHSVSASSIEDMIQFAHYTSQDLSRSYDGLLAKAVSEGQLKEDEARDLSNEYRQGAKASTYLE